MKKLWIFDLDSVLIDSEETMSISWGLTRDELGLSKMFQSY